VPQRHEPDHSDQHADRSQSSSLGPVTASNVSMLTIGHSPLPA
jgi:hypothetical protein